MKTSYRTLAKPSSGYFKDRGSRFIALAYPVQNENDVKELLDKLKKEYHDARHHCYAWRIGIEPVNVRANDDGEPSNSAGRPILNQIEKYDLTNIAIVVIRYFGGTLLGVGGLINAYRTAAESAIKSGRIIRKSVRRSYSLKFEYAQMNDVMTIIKEHQLETDEQAFELSCSLIFSVDLAKEESVLLKFKLIEGCELKSMEAE
jgi:uncharacterized YigZ family protein